MKRKVTQICSLVGLLVGLIISAQAQSGTQYRAHIPFDFNVGNKTLPAGDYVIRSATPTSGQSVLTILETKSSESKFVQVIPREAKEMSKIAKLVFNRYDNQYFLAEMITPMLSAEFRKTKVETRLAKTQKSNQQTVAMSR